MVYAKPPLAAWSGLTGLLKNFKTAKNILNNFKTVPEIR
jgi:hypothetical protein